MDKEIKINVNGNGFGWLSTLLTIAFVVLKLCNVISWSWFIVFLPIIIDIAFIVLVLIVVLIICLIIRIRSKI